MDGAGTLWDVVLRDSVRSASSRVALDVSLSDICLAL